MRLKGAPARLGHGLARRSAWVTPVLLGVALASGGWKVHALGRANRELARQNRQCTSVLREAARAVRQAQAGALRRGSKATGFSLLGLEGRVVAIDPARERGTVHVIFADPAHPEFARAVADYRRRFGSRRASRRVLVTVSGPEWVGRGARPPGGFEIAAHGGEVFRTYGFGGLQGLAVVEKGVLRERWRLPLLADELPILD